MRRYFSSSSSVVRPSVSTLKNLRALLPQATSTTSTLRFTSTATPSKKSHLPLAQISPAVLHQLKQQQSHQDSSSSSSSLSSSLSLTHNEQRELALIQRFAKLDAEKRNKALLSLCSTGSFELVPFALAAGCDFAKAVDPNSGATPLFYACAHGHAECARKFLESMVTAVATTPGDGDVGCRDGDGNVLKNALGSVKVAVQSPTPPSEGEEGQPPPTSEHKKHEKKVTCALLEALKNSHAEIVKILSQEVPGGLSASLLMSNEESSSLSSQQQKQAAADEIVLAAVQSGNGSMIRTLFSEEAVNQNNNNNNVGADSSSSSSSSLSTHQLLHQSLTISKYGSSQYTAFWLACMHGSADVVGAMLDCSSALSSLPLFSSTNSKIDLNAKTAPPNEMSALAVACLQGHADVVRTLLTRSTNSTTSEALDLDVNVRSTSTMGRTQDKGDTPLMIAVTQAAIASKSSALKQQQERYEDIARMLIDEPRCRIDEARGESDDMTPLLVACARDCPKLVAMLLEGAANNSGSNPNKKINIKYQSKKSELTPLLAAAYVGSDKIFSELLAAAANERLELDDEELLTACIPSVQQNILHVAIANGHSDLVEAIVTRLVFPKLVAATTSTSTSASIKEKLLEGRTVDLVTPLLYALHKRDLKSVQVLCDAGANIEHDGVNLAGVCESEEGMEEFAKILKRAEIQKEIAKKQKARQDTAAAGGSKR